MNRLSNRLRLAVSILLLGSAPSYAATAEGAAQIAAALQAYAGKTQGFAKAEADGERYRVTLDFAALANTIAKAADPASPTLQFAPMQFYAAPLGGGQWAVTRTDPLNFEFSAGDDFRLALKTDSMSFDAVFDEKLRAFTSTKSEIKGFAFTEHVRSAETGLIDVDYRIDSITYNGSGSDAGGGAVDAKDAYVFTGLHQISKSAPPAPGEMAMDIDVRAASGTQNTQFKGMKTGALLDLVKWTFNTLPQDGDSLSDAQVDELKSAITAALPVFSQISAEGTIDGMSVGTPIGAFGLAKAEFAIGLNGVVHDGLLREALTFEKLTMPAGLAPDFSIPFIPERLRFDVQVTGYDLAAPAALMLDNFRDFIVPIPDAQLEAKLKQAFLPTGAVTVTLNGFDAKSGLYDLAADGSMIAGEGVKPSGKGAVRAKTLLPLIAALQALPKELGMDMAGTALIAFNAMGKKQADGSLLWEIEGEEGGKFLINGVDFAALASMGSRLPDQE